MVTNLYLLSLLEVWKLTCELIFFSRGKYFEWALDLLNWKKSFLNKSAINEKFKFSIENSIVVIILLWIDSTFWIHE
jgi:hypothetical protein